MTTADTADSSSSAERFLALPEEGILHLLKDPLRATTRERQKQLVAVSVVVLLVSLTIVRVTDPTVASVGGVKVSLQSATALAALAFAVVTYYLVLFIFDAYQDLRLFHFGSIPASEELEKHRTQADVAIKAQATALEEHVRKLRQLARRPSTSSIYDEEIRRLEDRHQQLMAGPLVGPDAVARAEEASQTFRDLVELYQLRRAPGDQFIALGARIHRLSIDKTVEARLALITSISSSHRRLTRLRLGLEIAFPILLAGSALAAVLYRLYANAAA